MRYDSWEFISSTVLMLYLFLPKQLSVHLVTNRLNKLRPHVRANLSTSFALQFQTISKSNLMNRKQSISNRRKMKPNKLVGHDHEMQPKIYQFFHTIILPKKFLKFFFGRGSQIEPMCTGKTYRFVKTSRSNVTCIW